MKPVVIVDSNALYGRNAFTRADTRLALALARAGHIRLIVPEVVLLELARQWKDAADKAFQELYAALSDLNVIRGEIGEDDVSTDSTYTNPYTRQQFLDHVRQLLADNAAEVPSVPQVPIRTVLDRDLESRKPFNQDGRGFRDTLIWQTVVDNCEKLSAAEGGLRSEDRPSILFVTNNHKDFCDPTNKFEPHPHLKSDLPGGVNVHIAKDIGAIRKHEAIAPLIPLVREKVLQDTLDEFLTKEGLLDLIEDALNEIFGTPVDKFDVYVGEGMSVSPISLGLEDASFDDIEIAENTITHEAFGSEDDMTIRVRFEADCTFVGLIDKGEYWLWDEDGPYALLGDWNDYFFAASASQRVRFTLSGTFTDQTYREMKLRVDEIEDANDSGGSVSSSLIEIDNRG